MSSCKLSKVNTIEQEAKHVFSGREIIRKVEKLVADGGIQETKKQK